MSTIYYSLFVPFKKRNIKHWFSEDILIKFSWCTLGQKLNDTTEIIFHCWEIFFVVSTVN